MTKLLLPGALFFLCFAVIAQDSTQDPNQDPYILVLTNGKTMKVREAPIFKGKLCVVALLSGETTSIPIGMIDQGKTVAFNQRVADAKEEAALIVQAVEKEQAAMADEVTPAPKKIVLKRTSDLEGIDRDRNFVEGAVESVIGDDTAVAGQTPVERSFTSKDPVYMAKERIIKLQSGYRVECELAVNDPTGVTDVKLGVKVFFRDAPSEEYTLSATPSEIGFGQTAKVEFRLQADDEILQTNYQVSGTIVGGP